MAAVKPVVAAGSIASRAVHLKITPAPRNIRESREILKLVKGYGDLTMFKNMRVRNMITASQLHAKQMTV